jgi:hypothetical protein
VRKVYLDTFTWFKGRWFIKMDYRHPSLFTVPIGIHFSHHNLVKKKSPINPSNSLNCSYHCILTVSNHIKYRLCC